MEGKTDRFEVERLEMVRTQIERRGVRDQHVLEAMRKVPRHLFIPRDNKIYSYSDFPLSIGQGQTISQPYIVAAMSELLALKGYERVLEIGTGSGYQTAILCELAGEVFSIERIKSLADIAQERLAALGYSNVHVSSGDGTLGWKEYAPYEAILVTAASPSVPHSLISQLAEGGRLVIPVGERYSQVLQLWEKQGGQLHSSNCMGVVFVPLIGEEGWED